MKTYPIMLNLHGRLAVVVGGGNVGLRKARSLRDAGADVKLVAGSADNSRGLSGLKVLAEPYRVEHRAGAALVFACTDDTKLNSEIAADARRIGALVNVADTPDECDFFVPAVAGDGDVVLAVGTGGSAPALARHLKEHLRRHLPRDTGKFAALLGSLRERAKKELPDPEKRRSLMERLAENSTFELFVAKGPGAVAAMFDKLIAGL